MRRCKGPIFGQQGADCCLRAIKCPSKERLFFGEAPVHVCRESGTCVTCNSHLADVNFARIDDRRLRGENKSTQDKAGGGARIAAANPCNDFRQDFRVLHSHFCEHVLLPATFPPERMQVVPRRHARLPLPRRVACSMG